jgi:hypothetical protein
MDILPFVMLVALGFFLLKKSEQRKRIALLGRHLSSYQIEKLMETLVAGYMRALGESDAQRREQVWRHLDGAEAQLAQQFSRFSAEFSRLAEGDTRVSTLTLAVPYAANVFPQATFDVRQALALHAQALTQAAANPMHRTLKEKAFLLSAELLLIQHTCHWFCNSKTVASARLLARHKTSHEQVLAAVASETRAAYRTLTGT